VNLADRWPRHIVKAVEMSSPAETEEAYTTLAPNSNPAAPSVGDTLAASDSQQKLQTTPLPAQQPSKAEDPRTVEAPKAASLAIRGVRIPQRPPPPGPEDCCMSGCAHCAYDIYADDLQDFHAEASAARASLLALDPPLAPDEWPAEHLGARPTQSAGKGAAGMPSEQARATAESEVDAVIGGLDPTMAAFLKMEKAMKKKAASAASPAAASSP
jgi:aarF domain-containing kinase